MNILYIDPGTGSLIISLIIAALISLKNFFINSYYELKSLITNKNYKRKVNFSEDLVFFSEGEKYWNVFQPVIKELFKKKQKVIYLTAENSDPGLKINSEFIESYYIGAMNDALAFLNKLKAKLLVSTTPQLDIFSWKYTRNIRHYCYINHSPVDIHSYKKFAFDYYDSILCTSEFQITNLIELEKKRKSKKKTLLKTGCTYYDVVGEIKHTNKEFILLAPTWGERSFFSKSGISIIEKLLKANFDIVYRPHPQSFLTEKKLIERIELKFGENVKFKIDKSTDNFETLSRSSILITDISSGMIYDSIFKFNIPVIAVDFNWDDGSYESSDLETISSTKLLINEYGKVISGEEDFKIDEVVMSINKKNFSYENIDKYIFNYKKASKIACNQILELFNSI